MSLDDNSYAVALAEALLHAMWQQQLRCIQNGFQSRKFIAFHYLFVKPDLFFRCMRIQLDMKADCLWDNLYSLGTATACVLGGLFPYMNSRPIARPRKIEHELDLKNKSKRWWSRRSSWIQILRPSGWCLEECSTLQSWSWNPVWASLMMHRTLFLSVCRIDRVGISKS